MTWQGLCSGRDTGARAAYRHRNDLHRRSDLEMYPLEYHRAQIWLFLFPSIRKQEDLQSVPYCCKLGLDMLKISAYSPCVVGYGHVPWLASPGALSIRAWMFCEQMASMCLSVSLFVWSSTVCACAIRISRWSTGVVRGALSCPRLASRARWTTF